jgi:hypothetical protein
LGGWFVNLAPSSVVLAVPFDDLRTPFVVLTRLTVNSPGSFVNLDGSVRWFYGSVRCFEDVVREFAVAVRRLGGSGWCQPRATSRDFS